MKITKIETIPIRLPTRRVHQWASLTTPIGVYVIIKLHTDEGLIGLGEAPVLKDWGGDHGKYFGETPQTTMHIVNDILAPALNGPRPEPLRSDSRADGQGGERLSLLQSGHRRGALRCRRQGIESSRLSIARRACFASAFRIAHSLGLMEIEKAVEEALQAKSEGVKTIKLKGGVDQKRDVELVKQIRQAIGPDLNICVDANQGYPTPKPP